MQKFPIRFRLTSWYVLILAAGLLLYIAGTAFALYFQLYHQLTRFAIEDIETVEGLLLFKPDGALFLNEDYHNHPQSRKVLERYLEVLTPRGDILFRNERLGANQIAGSTFEKEGVDGYSERRAELTNGEKVVLVSRRHVLNNRAIIIRLAYSQNEIWSRITELLTASFTALPFLLGVAGILGYQLAGRLLAPLEKMAKRAEEITADRLEQRLPVENPDDELGHLARIFNIVLDRLQQSFAQLRRFTSDASHELRTPLAAIRSVGEVGLQKSRTAADYQDTIGSMLEEVARLTKLVENLLTISRADAGQVELNLSVFSPLELVREVITIVDVLAEERKQVLSAGGDPGLVVQGDRLLLRQALINVIHNAVKYSPLGGRISVEVASPTAGVVTIRISDTGPGIEPEQRQKIFDRFYRVDEARARDTGGVGLGLSIASWAVHAQGGEIRVEDGTDGAVFAIDLRVGEAKRPILDAMI